MEQMRFVVFASVLFALLGIHLSANAESWLSREDIEEANKRIHSKENQDKALLKKKSEEDARRREEAARKWEEDRPQREARDKEWAEKRRINDAMAARVEKERSLAEERKAEVRQNKPPDCYSLYRYAEAKGHNWIEISGIVNNAKSIGECKDYKTQ